MIGRNITRDDLDLVFEKHSLWLKTEGKMGTRANLSMCNLSGRNFRGADLRQAVLKRTRFIWADLANANLSGADLTGAVFVHADLSKCQLIGARLRGATFMKADLTGADFNNADIRSVNFQKTILEDVYPSFELPLDDIIGIVYHLREAGGHLWHLFLMEIPYLKKIAFKSYVRLKKRKLSLHSLNTRHFPEQSGCSH